MEHSLAVSLPPLRRKILRSFLVMVALYGGLAAVILGAVYLASGITPRIIHVNYDSIAAATAMREAWFALRHPEDFPHKSLAASRKQFEEALRFEEGNITEPGEGKIAGEIRRIWEETKKSPDTLRDSFQPMQIALRDLVSVNETAMFSMAEKSTSLRTRALVFGGVIFLIALVFAIIQSDSLANRVANPLKEIAEALRNKPTPGEKLRLPTPESLELRILTHEMNQLWKRLSELRALNLEELSTQRNKLSVVLEAVEDAILVIDNFGNVLQCNQGLSDLLALPLPSINGHKWQDLATGNENYLKLRELLTPQMAQNSSAELAVGGEARVFSARCRKIVSKAEETAGIVYLLHDITERKQRDRLKEEFIAVLSHELKTPLQSLGTASELLLSRKGNMDEDGRMLIDTVHDDVERIRAVAQDFMQVSFVDPHSLRLRMGRHALSELIQDWIKPFRLVARDKKVRIEFEKDGPDVIWADLDAVKFPWAISNLLSNAIRFSPSESTVTVSLREKATVIEIEIRDEGPGIPEGMRKKMFDPYFQVPSSESKIPSGFLGLGLTIAKELVEAHLGTIEYLPGKPTGSIFRITLPNAKKEA